MKKKLKKEQKHSELEFSKEFIQTRQNIKLSQLLNYFIFLKNG